ncbi:integral membrane protein TIGR01906 [Ignavigranum ruoffiae]|uniref:Integral membrane protein TIGR01906 n=1 Tax=Ignavigranum ruoffiae TaxID=89093 RepID=A0A1H9GVA0_9LACT|nr:TIGR01906 family membrane protein [Ignavigranum ruoffiae]SEQ53959.1 integral membrane protein TIGR01906 [Ignavigranum ruoffiae]
MAKHGGLKVAASLNFIIFSLSGSVLMTLLTSPWLYRPFITWFQLEQLTGLSYHQIALTYDEIIIFLLNPQQKSFSLSYFASSAQGAQHFVDVKFLIFLLIVIFMISAGGLIYFLQRKRKRRLKRQIETYFYFSMALPIFLLLAMIFAFDRFFILFHQVLFANDYWLFNPATDPVIQILPQEFFFVVFFVAILGYELIQYGLYSWVRR